MEIQDVSRVFSVSTEHQANDLLDAGWVLLRIDTSESIIDGIGTECDYVFLLGWKRSGEPPVYPKSVEGMAKR